MAIASINKWLVKIFGSRNERLVKAYMQSALAAGQYEEQVKGLSDEDLKGKTAEFKQRLQSGSRPEEILPEAFAVVREAARRNVNMRHFDVQLVGGNVLYDGKIAEMATGEGKTLVATLAAYLVHLTGKHVHIVTVNDYLAKRDAEWMGPIYRALGLSVGAIQADMDTAGQERRDQYNCDITYGTNNEFGFDYLRDNMKLSLEQMAQGPLEYAIIDEVDSILVDEARTPLIISGPAFDDVSRYKKADSVARQLIAQQRQYNTSLVSQIKDKEYLNQRAVMNRVSLEKMQEIADKFLYDNFDLDEEEAELIGLTQVFVRKKDTKSVDLTHEGIGLAQKIAGIGSFFTGSDMDWPHMLKQALRAHMAFERETDYVVMDGKVIIVDEFTGRLMHGRQWSDGLHQAVEAKENVQVKEETQTLATITLQNFFKLYEKIAGMTGTAATEAEEFMKIYKLDVVVIPTNRPCVRDDRDDLIFKTMREKFNAIVDEIYQTSTAGLPVLVGTVSIEKSEAISQALTRQHGLDHEVLNAKQHAREAAIVEKAGHQHAAPDGSMRGNVTIATNMAGRGTDIKLGPGVLFEVQKIEDSTEGKEKGVKIYTLRQESTDKIITFKSTDPLAGVFQIRPGQKRVGGLHILGTERHEARRIDNQLRGRSGRQGDPGTSQFFLCFDDDLLRIFSPDWVVKALSMPLMGWEEGMPIQHRRISKGIEKAQKKVEERNFEIRKSLLEYDEVMDYQRKIFYSRRRSLLAGEDLQGILRSMLDAVIEKAVRIMLDPLYPYHGIVEWARSEFGVELDSRRLEGMEPGDIEQQIKETAAKNVSNDISISLGEYLEDYGDPSTWKLDALTKWAMSAFKVSLSAGKLRHMSAEEIEQTLVEAACEQVHKKDASRLREFLKEDFALSMLRAWARGKFAIEISIDDLKNKKADAIRTLLMEKVHEKYTRRQIEYPVEFAMNMAFGPQGPNVYAFEALAEWANKRYQAGLTLEEIQNSKPEAIYKKLLALSESYHSGRLEKEVGEKVKWAASMDKLADWANQRFEARFTAGDFPDREQAEAKILEAGRRFLRQELTELEKYVLLQIHDSTWKDHLYSMDHLKESIMLRAYAEKDPKVEYKHEGYQMFEQMLESIEDKVTDIIFRVRLDPKARARSVWNVSRTQHDQVGQFEMDQRQRAAAQAPQGEQKVKTIRLEQPKIGRNDPCPCGSGKKYKKCCGQNA
jgi:preprotein translocase subunit SecA